MGGIIPPSAYRNKEITEKINFIGTKNLITNLEKNSPDAFFAFTSSVATYGDRLNNPNISVTDALNTVGDYYAVSKIKAEEVIQNSKLRWTIFRLSAIMGADNHKMSGIMFLMPLKTPMEITSPEDTARAFVNSIEHQRELAGKTFNLGGGEKNRIIYKDFLQKNFELFGLGKLDFPTYAFVQKNYHCGYYTDSDDLDNIVHFRQDTLNTYFEKVQKSVSAIQKLVTILFRRIIKGNLLAQSAPYTAFKQNDKEKMSHYFDE